MNSKEFWLRGTVSRVLCLKKVVTIHLGRWLPKTAQATYPTTGGAPRLPSYLVLLQVGLAWPERSPARPVSSYLTLSPLPWRTIWFNNGGLLSVALARGYPRWALPSTSPCGARTFLPVQNSHPAATLSRPNQIFLPKQLAIENILKVNTLGGKLFLRETLINQRFLSYSYFVTRFALRAAADAKASASRLNSRRTWAISKCLKPLSNFCSSAK